MPRGIKVSAPATISNINCGFDALGLALNFTCDEIVGRLSKTPGIHLTHIGSNARSTPCDPTKNTVTVAIDKFLEALGESKSVGIELEVKKMISPGSGLGSSAAGACAGVMLANELLGKPMEKRELLPFAIHGEYVADEAWHADNVAPCLLGGAILIREMKPLDIHRLYTPLGLYVTVVTPQIRILTKEARDVLSEKVDFQKSVKQAANLASFVHAMHTSDFELLGRSLQDHLVEEQRAHLLPGFYDAKSAAMTKGALGCGISGSGPTIFVISNNHNCAHDSAEEITKVYSDKGIESSYMVSEVNQAGTVLC
jgi:homoserine kinase